MKIYRQSDMSVPIIDRDLDIVIQVRPEIYPEIFLEKDVARPDRHFLIGLVQLCTVAVEEQDPEFVSCCQDNGVVLEMNGQKNRMSPSVFIFKSHQGQAGCVCCYDPSTSRRIMRDALRRLTGTVRLDIP